MNWRRRGHLLRLAWSVRPRKKSAWSIENLVGNVERATGEKVILVPVDPSAVSGVCGSRLHIDKVNRLFVPASSKDRVRGISQELVAVHELSHVLCGHRALSQSNAEKLLAELRQTWPGVPEDLLHTHVNDKQALREEEEAEFVSAAILRSARPPSAFGTALSALGKQRSRSLNTLFGGSSSADRN